MGAVSLIGIIAQLASTLLGFGANFVPDIIGFFKKRQDNAHEIAMLDAQVKWAKEATTWKAQEIREKGDTAAFVAAQRAGEKQPTMGVTLLDGLKDSGFPSWAMAPLICLFGLLAFLVAFVRPGVTYALVIFYIGYKVALFKVLVAGGGITSAGVFVQLWNEHDWILLDGILGYWFGWRVKKRENSK